jgi:ATP-binding cassette, subfamily B, bacterial
VHPRTGDLKRRSSDVATLRTLWQQARECHPHLYGILALSLSAAPLALLLPLPLKIAVDSVLGHTPLPRYLAVFVPQAPAQTFGVKLAAVVIFLLAIATVSHGQQLASWLLQTYTGEKLVLDFRAKLFWASQRFSLATHEDHGKTDIAYRIQNDAPAIQYILIQGVVPIVTAAATLAAMFWVIGQVHPQFAVLAAVLCPVLFAVARRSSKRIRPRWDKVKELDTRAMAVMQEALHGIQVVKAYAQEAAEDVRFQRDSEARMREQVGLASVQASDHVVVGTVMALGSAAALWIGVRQVEAGALSLGGLLLAMSYLVQIYAPLSTLSAKFPELQGSLSSARRALELLDEKVEEHGSIRPETPRVRGTVTFENVAFKYANGRRAALDDITCEIPAGTRVGIVGASGAGKSTLVALLTRFYEPSTGAILLDGVDLRALSLAELRANVSMVLQETVLFSTTVAENIAYGRPTASRDQVVAAAQAARIHDFIQTLPKGYETPIGRGGGVRFSGGERQRLGLARAFLKDAPLVILDEPTSALDAATESEVMLATDELLRGRTSFLIAHRLHTLESCDLLLHLQCGKLVGVTSNVRAALSGLVASKDEGRDAFVVTAASRPC